MGQRRAVSNIRCNNPYKCNVFSSESSVCLAVPQLHQPDQRKPNTDFSPRIQDGGRTKNYHGCCCWSSASTPPIIGSLPVNMFPSGSSSDGRLRDLNKFKINSKYFSSFSKILTKFRLRLRMCSCWISQWYWECDPHFSRLYSRRRAHACRRASQYMRWEAGLKEVTPY